MIEKEEWMQKHKAGETEWHAFKLYCLDCGFKSGIIKGREVIFSPIFDPRMEDKS